MRPALADGRPHHEGDWEARDGAADDDDEDEQDEGGVEQHSRVHPPLPTGTIFTLHPFARDALNMLRPGKLGQQRCRSWKTIHLRVEAEI